MTSTSSNKSDYWCIVFLSLVSQIVKCLRAVGHSEKRRDARLRGDDVLDSKFRRLLPKPHRVKDQEIFFRNTSMIARYANGKDMSRFARMESSLLIWYDRSNNLVWPPRIPTTHDIPCRKRCPLDCEALIGVISDIVQV